MDQAKNQKEYEIAFLVKDEQNAEEIKQNALRFGFSVTDPGEVRRLELAYLIEKERGAWFGFFRANASADAIKEFSDELSLNASCIRHMIINDPPQKPIERPMRPLGTGRPQIRKEEVTHREQPVEQKQQGDMVTNEELEKKLEEILK